MAGGDLPAGNTVEQKSGSYHTLLMDLNAPWARDSSVALQVAAAAVVREMKKGVKAAMDGHKN